MTDTKTTNLTDAEEAYVMGVFREVARIAARSRRGFDADDIASEVALAVAARPGAIMASYPDPVSYARQRARHAGISFDRRERAQRGEGARLFVGNDGLQRPGRRVVSGNVTGTGGCEEAIALIADLDVQVEIAATERMVTAALLQQCFAGLSTSEIREVWLVDGCGYSIHELATFCGQRRETVSRRLNNSRRRIRSNRVAMSPAEQEAFA